jgi:hypothetical protein
MAITPNQLDELTTIGQQRLNLSFDAARLLNLVLYGAMFEARRGEDVSYRMMRDLLESPELKETLEKIDQTDRGIMTPTERAEVRVLPLLHLLMDRQTLRNTLKRAQAPQQISVLLDKQ